MKLRDIPIMTGAGSQPVEEGDELQVVAMPSSMEAYRTPVLPEPETVAELNDARRVFESVRDSLKDYRVGQPTRRIDVSQLGDADLDLVNQILGEGEVSVLLEGDARLRIQESVLAGVWRIQRMRDDGSIAGDTIAVADVPDEVCAAVARAARDGQDLVPPQVPAGVVNSPALLVEIVAKARSVVPYGEAHVINLTLLPVTPEDLQFLEQMLGVGPVTILSRGFGNCRITSTTMANTWWVRYHNSMDTLILNTIEVVDVPAAARAAQEDIDDNLERLTEIMEIFR